MNNFEKWNKKFNAQDLYSFNCNENGLLWLKTRALCRRKQMEQFLAQNNICLTSTKLTLQNVELFELLERTPSAMTMLNDFLKQKSHEWYELMGIDETKLKEDLYKVQFYVWGGNQNNSLDKHLVSRYVKTISKYDDLVGKKMEIEQNAWQYVQTSWYNNWTSYLVESLFKRHQITIPAVGEMKSVDFFIDGYPIDLKITFFPHQYMDVKLKEKLGRAQLPWLKQQAKEVGLTIDNDLSESLQLYTLSEQLSDMGHSYIVNDLRDKRKEIVMEAEANPIELMTWLYSNQGEMRFGAENRLYLVLVDTTDMSQSWKMKRAFSLIEPKVNNYLNTFDDKSLKKISFTYKGDRYKTLSDIIFVTK